MMKPAFRRVRARRLLTCAAVCAVAAGAPLLPALPTAPTPAATASPAANAPLDATDAAALRPHLDEHVSVRGTPTTTGHNKAGSIGYLNFAGAHRAVALVFFFHPGDTGSLASEEDLKRYVGKPIVVTGTLTDYKGDLQIKVESSDQIKPAP